MNLFLINKFMIEENKINENYKTNICCICYNIEYSNGMIHCDVCNEGHICIDCYEIYEEYQQELHNTIFYINCPICKNLLISYTKHQIIIYNLLIQNCPDHFRSYKSDILYKRWYDNFTKTDIFSLYNI